MSEKESTVYVITAGSAYLDIDAYACMVAMSELFALCGEVAVAYSKARPNYSVCPSLVEEGQVVHELPKEFSCSRAEYVIVDVSDPNFLKNSVPLERVARVYDHHVGFENYWKARIGEGARIEFLGAAATLIYREWKRAGLEDKMSRSTALLLIAAILDNTLNLTSANTTAEDVAVFDELCKRENIGKQWCAAYFSEVQLSVEADLKNAILGDIKIVRGNAILPPRVAQLCVWDTAGILAKLPEIRELFADASDGWMINIIDVKDRLSYFLCDDEQYQRKIEEVFGVRFISSVVKTEKSYLRKEIIKKTLS